MAPRIKIRLGDLLVNENQITSAQLDQALQEQKNTGRRLGATLIDLGLLSELELMQFLAKQLGIPFIDLQSRRLDAATAQLIPEVHARRYRALALDDQGESLLVGTSDPIDLNMVDALEAMVAPKRVSLAVVRESQLIDAFNQLYRRTKEIENYAEQLEAEYDQGQDDFSLDMLGEGEGEATVVRMLQSIFEDAVQVRASDVHIEPDESVIRIRQRVDGILQESVLNEVRIASALVLRLKLMAGLDISEKRLPQDGRFNIKVKNRSIDVRMSTMPVQYGESVVMRLLDQSSGILALEQTGIPEPLLKRLRMQLSRPHGMILVTGPTGSGKTTTLYGALSELNQPGKKIITVEDPVEYRLPRINQVQVNAKIDLTFSQVLRTTLRQDPDIIMVGEMRDTETVEIGLRGALTGHLVLSTLHTNDAISSALRLLDMGAPGYLVASSLRAIIAQRLARRICDNCRTAYQPTESEQLWLAALHPDAAKERYFHGAGCQSCSYTGYKGRVGVFEMLEMDESMMQALRRGEHDGFASAAKANRYYRPLAVAALDDAQRGVTTVEEVLRLAEHLADDVPQHTQGA